MLISISREEFISDFMRFRKEQFSREALEFLYDWYDENIPDVPVDFVGLCCDWTEYDSMTDLREAYPDDDVDHFVLSNGHILAENV